MFSCGSQLIFAKNASPPSSGFFELLFHPEDEGDMFFRNVGLLPPDFTALYIIRQNSSTVLFGGRL
jgi:hypothetical protein